MKETRDFRFKQFNLVQKVNAMKFGTDAAILGAYAISEQPKKILDIGTGTGVLALMLAQRYPMAHIDAVELDEASAIEAAYNLEKSFWSDRMQVVTSDIKLFDGADYDIIVSNPPYFVNSYKNPSESRSRVRHAECLQFDDLLSLISLKLSKKGVAYIILPFTAKETIEQLAKNEQIQMNEILEIYSYIDSEAPVRAIFKFSLESRELDIKKLYIYKDKGMYSDDFIRLLKPYYLNL